MPRGNTPLALRATSGSHPKYMTVTLRIRLQSHQYGPPRRLGHFFFENLRCDIEIINQLMAYGSKGHRFTALKRQFRGKVSTSRKMLESSSLNIQSETLDRPN